MRFDQSISLCKKQDSNTKIRTRLYHYLNNDFVKEKNNSRQQDKANVNKNKLNPIVINMQVRPYCTETSSYCGKRLRVFHKVKEIISAGPKVEGTSFFMHGSYAVGGITEFSDIDLGLIVSKDTSSEELILLRKLVRKILGYIYSIDPLMHHGIDIILTQDLIDYDESILPVNTLRKSVVLNGHANFDFFINHRLSVLSAKNRLYRMCESVILYEDKLVNHSAYKLKGLISVVLLITVLFVQVDTGVFLCKHDSIIKFREDYKEKFSFQAIDMATEFREMWSVPIYVNIIMYLLYNPM